LEFSIYQMVVKAYVQISWDYPFNINNTERNQ
jgi:hypothetical protein